MLAVGRPIGVVFALRRARDLAPLAGVDVDGVEIGLAGASTDKGEFAGVGCPGQALDEFEVGHG